MHGRKFPTILFAMLLMVLPWLVQGAVPHPKIRISAWYWLNSAPKPEWARDFTQMSKMGFTDVLLCWGLDAAAFGLPNRSQDTLDAMRMAEKVGMGSYIVF